VNALQLSQLSAAKNTGGQSTLRTNRSGSGASTDRSDSDSEMGTQRQTDRPLDSSRQVCDPIVYIDGHRCYFVTDLQC